MPPDEIRSRLDAGTISLGDILVTVQYKASIPFLGENVFKFIDIEHEAKKKKVADEINQLGQILKSTDDPESRRNILDKIKRLGQVLEEDDG